MGLYLVLIRFIENGLGSGALWTSLANCTASIVSMLKVPISLWVHPKFNFIFFNQMGLFDWLAKKYFLIEHDKMQRMWNKMRCYLEQLRGPTLRNITNKLRTSYKTNKS